MAFPSLLRTPHASIGLLKTCILRKDLALAKQLQAHLTHHPPLLTGLLGDYLVLALAKCGAVDESLQVCLTLPCRTVFMWTAIISAYSDSGYGHLALQAYQKMQVEGIEPNHYTFVSLFKACGTIPDVVKGLHLHGDAIIKGFAFDAFVGNTLVSMYGKCGALTEAEVVFCSLPGRSIVSWNAMLSAYVEQSQGDKALLLHRQLQEEGPSPNRTTFVIILQACSILAEQEETLGHPLTISKVGALQIVRGLHALVRSVDLASDTFIGTALVNAYSKCRALLEAEHLFSVLSQHDIVSWNAILSAYVDEGQSSVALLAYKQLQEKGLSPNKHSFVFALQACSILAEEKEAHYVKGQLIKAMPLEIGVALHADAITQNLTSNIIIDTVLLTMYSKCGAIMEAQKVFDALPQPDLLSWNTMLSSYVDQGHGERALQLYRQMLEELVRSDQITIILACQACSILAGKEQAFLVQGHSMKVKSLEIGQALHADAGKKGLGSFVATTFISFYGKCGAMMEAEHLFNGLPQQDVVSWTALISLYVEQRQGEKALQSYRQMQEEGICPNQHTFVYSLRACVVLAGQEDSLLLHGGSNKVMSLEIGRALHADARSKNFAVDTFVGTALLSMYGECGALFEAEDVFRTMSKRDITSYNAMISKYVKHAETGKALLLYRQLQEEGIHKDQLTVALALQACTYFGATENVPVVKGHTIKSMRQVIGQALHADARRIGNYASHTVVGNTLVNMYSKWGAILEAENVFGGLSERDVGSWNSLLSAYLEQGQQEKVLQLYKHMQEEGTSPDQESYVIILCTCSTLAEREDSKQQLRGGMIMDTVEAVHADTYNQGFIDDPVVTSLLIVVYGRLGIVSKAEQVFSALSQPDVASWNAMLSAYTEQCQGEKALLFHEQMLKEGKTGDDVTLICLLQACCDTSCLDSCKQYHFDIVSAGYDSILSVAASLIRTYGSCASMLDAHSVLEMLLKSDIVPVSACIAGHGREGNALASLRLFEELKVAGMKPDGLLFTSVLQACSHAGLVVQGTDYFKSMRIEHSILPGLKHYGSLIDVHGRAGDMRKVKSLLMRMPMQADNTILSSILALCHIHYNVPRAEAVFDHAINLQSKQVGACVLTSNIFAHTTWQECG